MRGHILRTQTLGGTQLQNIEPFALKEYFYTPRAAQTEFNLSRSFAEPLSVGELLSLEPEATEQLSEMKLGYTGLDGTASLRQAISAQYAGLSADQIIVTSGLDDALTLLSLSLIEKGDRVIVYTPCYQTYMTVPAWRGAEVVEWRGDPNNNWQPDLGQLADLLQTPAKWVIVNFPNNPTAFTPDETYLNELAALLAASETTLLCDEIYSGLGLSAETPKPMAVRYGKAVSMHSVSKTLGLPGLRIGWLASQDQGVLDQIRTLRFHFNSFIGAPSEFLAQVALRNADKILNQNLQILTENAEIAGEFFHRHQNRMSWTTPQAGVNAFPEWHGEAGTLKLCDRLADEAKVLLAPSQMFGAGDRHFRLGLGCRDFAAALERFDGFISKLQ